VLSKGQYKYQKTDSHFRQQAKKEIEAEQNLNYYLCLPDTYDLVLKSSSLQGVDKKLIKYGLFLAYLDEMNVRSKTTRESRFIFNIEEIRRIVALFDNDLRSFIKFECLAYPIVPPRENVMNGQRFRSRFLDKEFNGRFNIKYSLEPYKGIRYNLNGSYLYTLLSNRGSSNNDVDIRLDYLDGREEYITDREFDEAVNNYIRHYKLKKPQKVLLSDDKTYKYQSFDPLNLKFEFYRGNFGLISNYHVPTIRMNFDTKLTLYPSCVIAWLSGVCLDLRYFTSANSDPMEIIEKYQQRGFTFYLNRNEYALYLEYLYEKSTLKDKVDFSVLQNEEDYDRRNIIYRIHNVFLANAKANIPSTIDRLKIPFE
jgi:hypothetical protein